MNIHRAFRLIKALSVIQLVKHGDGSIMWYRGITCHPVKHEWRKVPGHIRGGFNLIRQNDSEILTHNPNNSRSSCMDSAWSIRGSLGDLKPELNPNAARGNLLLLFPFFP